jgi:hypothetical protein
MLKILSSFGASSSFEKHRLILTTDNLEAPDQYSLKSTIIRKCQNFFKLFMVRMIKQDLSLPLPLSQKKFLPQKKKKVGFIC